MTRTLGGAFAAYVMSCLTAIAQPPACDGGWCRAEIYLLRSASETRSYAVLVSLPEDAPCAVARIVVADVRARPLGQTEALVPGAQGRVRIGQGYGAGVHPLRVMVTGCAARATGVRAITLGKASPDHGWRAGQIVLAAAAAD
jgi:hypothetical protein